MINVGRGTTVDEDALLAALRAGSIAGAALDVTVSEPLPVSSPLWDLPNVIITPHIGWRGLETRKRLVSILKDNITAFVNGEPINRVDNI